MPEEDITQRGQDWYVAGAGGGGKGGGGGDPPSEDPDTLRSRATASILAAICEGPVEGFATGSADESVFLNDTPLKDNAGESNFGRNVDVNFRAGNRGQDPIPGFNDVRIEQSVGIKVEKNAGPTSVTTTSDQLNRIIVRIGVSALYKVEENDGDVRGTDVEFDISIRDRNGASRGGGSYRINGKSRGPVDFEYPFSLSGPGPWSVRVTRTTADPDTIRTVNDLYYKAVVGIIDQSFRYPNTALVGLTLRAEGFSSIPKLSVKLKGMKIRVPTNYDVDAGTYSGVWDLSLIHI